MEHARDWLSVHSAAALIDGEPLVGHWFNRTREYAARNQGEAFSPLRFASEETVVLSPIPCWARLSPPAYRRRIRILVGDINAEPHKPDFPVARQPIRWHFDRTARQFSISTFCRVFEDPSHQDMQINRGRSRHDPSFGP